ncbi:rRNA maturation RNase YbeY [Aestuariicella hydrocarbonica]|uniref:Endoribonuclease YbeY n=1 Tax=Pseudomaricurvus hydrocarbonicus TaxID=1470433 RepID=A0A9E5JT17_9GAMM|nr:rRNA maturation RNase YbeY [Aestuariicella hydrocarbonica]NHO65038.1 rRNA maturation RNase YbeY [Aestuariicella hydrocarbonica]
MKTDIDNQEPAVDLCLDIQFASQGCDLPSEAQLQQWTLAALTQVSRHGTPQKAIGEQAELSIRIVDREESQQLNHQYRQKDKPTNVLSFPADLPAELNLPLLGDLVICAPVVTEEASEQNKTLNAHWAHMLVHGTLHLLGYDHINDSDAEIMEQLETDILRELGFPPPYETIA